MNPPIDWLLEGPAWVQYRTRCDLLHQPADDPSLQSARHAMLADPLIQNLLTELTGWEGSVVSSHKNAAQPFHKLTFLAEVGLTAADAGVEKILSHLFEHIAPEGPFQVLMNIPTHFGGTGMDQWAWALCDAPLTLYALLKFGLEEQPAVRLAVEYLTGLVRENGWPCAVSPQLGNFRGPGRKGDPCPFANLAMLKMLAHSQEYRQSPAAKTGAETLLHLWESSLSEHPYLFYMGTDFRKLKVPFIWYDLLHVLEVLSQFPWLRQDPRLLSMLDVLKHKIDAEEKFTLESVWMAWKEWEFGKKKVPSRWLTLLAWRILLRIEEE